MVKKITTRQPRKKFVIEPIGYYSEHELGAFWLENVAHAQVLGLASVH